MGTDAFWAEVHRRRTFIARREAEGWELVFNHRHYTVMRLEGMTLRASWNAKGTRVEDDREARRIVNRPVGRA